MKVYECGHSETLEPVQVIEDGACYIRYVDRIGHEHIFWGDTVSECRVALEEYAELMLAL